MGLTIVFIFLQKTVKKVIVRNKKGFIFASAKTSKVKMRSFSFTFIEREYKIRMTARIERYK